MSDNFLRLIPDVPEYVPSVERIMAAVSLLSCLGHSVIVDAEVYPDVQFVDQGGNFEAIYCPCCESELDLTWWGQAMDRAALFRFAELSVTTPCCGCATDLNNLRYYWPAGFARFCLNVRDSPPEIDASTMATLSEILGTTLRKVWVHC